MEKSQTQLSQLKETYKTQREQLTREIHELRQTLSEDAHKHEVEKNQLKEHIATVSSFVIFPSHMLYQYMSLIVNPVKYVIQGEIYLHINSLPP